MAADPSSLNEIYGNPVKILGEGHYGTVILTDKKYAVKITDRKIDELTNVEMNSMIIPSCIDHPNIIKYHDIYIGTKNISLIMDVYDNDISSAMQQDYKMFRPVRIFKSLCSQMINAVAYLTSRDIIHGDIKPPNILFKKISDYDYMFVLADFDFAHNRVCSSDKKISRHGNLYTPGYRPPEILIAEMKEEIPPDSFAGEVWALGITLAFIYRGEPSFLLDLDEIKRFVAYEDGGELSSSILPWKYHQRSFTVNPEVETFVRRMINFEPKRRVDIFTLQNDPFLHNQKLEKIPSVPCHRRILFFDRSFNFTVIEQTEELKIYWTQLTEWMLSIQNIYSPEFSSDIFIMAVELIMRYMISDTPGKGRMGGIGAAALYLAATFFNLSMSLSLFSSLTKFMFSAEEIDEKAIELLILFNYDLCAKTGYDEIYRYNGLIDSKILDLAVDVLKLAYTRLDLFAQNNTPQIILYLTTLFYNVELYNLNDDSKNMAELWKRKFLEYFYPIRSDEEYSQTHVTEIINSWVK